jgi:hypothetical protein
MVAETGLKWQDIGERVRHQVSVMYKVPALLLVLLLSLYPCAVRAQTTNASITGLVTDPSKATIPDSETVRVEAGTVRDAGWLQPLILSSSPVPIAIRHTDNESHESRQFRSACGNPTSNLDKRST